MIGLMKRLAATALLGIMAGSLAVTPAVGLGGSPVTARSQKASLAQSEKWRQPLSPRQKIELLLNRTTFGPRPGDLQMVERLGLNSFLEQQLHPDSIDDSALEARLQSLETLHMSPAQLAENFPPPMQAKRIEQRRLAALQRRQGEPPAGAASQDAAMVRGQSGDAISMRDAAPNDLRAPAPRPQGPREILLQLAQEQLLRAVYSRRQLQEVMVHFWMNHFNIYWPKGADRYYLTSFEQDVIRPRALGNFEDLLVATAESPAMQFYLDNWLSVSPDQSNRPYGPGFRPFGPPVYGPGIFRPFGPRFARQQKKPQNKRGLNENYGRELMELHTIGLHYTQKDVTEVARCFTGWTIMRPGQGGAFYFNPRVHDYGKKVVLGYTIPAGQGIEDGLEVLHILAMNPYTAHHIAYELCQHFVADAPPGDLVDRAAKTYLNTRGDIRSVLRTIFTSPEFYSRGAYEAKIKSPFEPKLCAGEGLIGWRS